MNGRQAKKIRRQAKELTVEWLQSLLPEAELERITTKNFKDYMPEQTHVFANMPELRKLKHAPTVMLQTARE